MSTILVADDNEMNREVAQRRLELRGYDVILAEDGQEAIDIARSAGPDAILMDLDMPVVDGYEATRTLKADDATCNIPIIALTGYGASEEAAALAAGCDALVSKPYQMDELVDVIELLMSDGG